MSTEKNAPRNMTTAEEFGVPILTTKLYRPLVTPDLAPRDRLLQRLESSRQRPLTLI